MNIPFSELTKRLSEVDKSKPVYVLQETYRGYDAYNIDGGYKAYKEYITAQPPCQLNLRGI